MTKESNLALTDDAVMAAFWHRTRRCAVPLLSGELTARLGLKAAAQIGIMMEGLERRGLIERELTRDSLRIYMPTERGARVAQKLIERRA